MFLVLMDERVNYEELGDVEQFIQLKKLLQQVSTTLAVVGRFNADFIGL